VTLHSNASGMLGDANVDPMLRTVELCPRFEQVSSAAILQRLRAMEQAPTS
jgi:hypothetical protein